MGYLKTALEQITAGSVYNYTVSLVTRSKRDIHEISDFPAVMIGDPEVRHEAVNPDYDRCWLTVLVVGLLKADDPETEVNYFAADIKNAVLMDSNAPHRQMTNVSRPEFLTMDSYAENGSGFVQCELEYFYTEEGVS